MSPTSLGSWESASPWDYRFDHHPDPGHRRHLLLTGVTLSVGAKVEQRDSKVSRAAELILGYVKAVLGQN